MPGYRIPYNRPYITGKEFGNIEAAIAAGYLSGDGAFAKRCQVWLEQSIGCRKAFIVHSGTAALELGALLMNLGPGDEVIMPSFTFVTTATAVALRGATPVFVDIRPDTLNIDERLVEAAITKETRAIIPVHYAGVGCEIGEIASIAESHGLYVFEDAAHAVQANYEGRALGSFGQIAALSFHETKNLTCGEGGALVINDPSMVRRAEILVEKGTNRSEFLLGLADKYTWHDVGSSFLASEIECAFLYAQMNEADGILAKRLAIWNFYHDSLKEAEDTGFLKRPTIPSGCDHNAHLYYILLNSPAVRDEMLRYLNGLGINAIFHYVPLHSSPAGMRLARTHGSMATTEDVSARILRLPLWIGLTMEQQRDIVDCVYKFFGAKTPRASLTADVV